MVVVALLLCIIVLGRYLFLRGFPRESTFSLSNIQVVTACFWLFFLWMGRFNFWTKSSPIWTLLGLSRMVCPLITALSMLVFCGWAQFSWFGLDFDIWFGLDLVLIWYRDSIFNCWFCFPVRHFLIWVFGVGSLSVHRFWPVSKSDLLSCYQIVRFWAVWRGSAERFLGCFFWVCFGLNATLRACCIIGGSIYS